MILILKKIKKLLFLCTNKIWFYGLTHFVAANIELKDILTKIKPKTIIDIGSNKGQFILLTNGLFKNLNYHSFEPQKVEIEIQKKIFRRFRNIKFYNFALGDKYELKKFYITNRKDSSSFLKITENLNKNLDYKIVKKKKIVIKPIRKILKIKNFKHPILVKIDVQGYEKKVLDGFGDQLKYIDFIIIEVSNFRMYQKQANSNEIINFLEKRKFKILDQNKWTKIKTNEKIMQKDILFVNNESKSKFSIKKSK